MSTAYHLPVSRGPGVKFDRIWQNEFMDDTHVPHSDTTLVIFGKHDGKKWRFRAVKSHGYLSEFRDDRDAELIHDQSRVRDSNWTVIANVRSPRDAFQSGTITRGYLQDRLIQQCGTDLDNARFALSVFK